MASIPRIKRRRGNRIGTTPERLRLPDYVLVRLLRRLAMTGRLVILSKNPTRKSS